MIHQNIPENIFMVNDIMNVNTQNVDRNTIEHFNRPLIKITAKIGHYNPFEDMISRLTEMVEHAHSTDEKSPGTQYKD